MAIAFGAQAISEATPVTSTTRQATLALSAGDLAVLCIMCRDGDSNPVTSVVGSVNTTGWTLVGSEQINAITAPDMRALIYYRENCSAGSETVTVTWGSTTRSYLNLSRWTGAATSSALDQSNGASITVAGLSHNCGSITTTGAGLIIACSIADGAAVETLTGGIFTALSATASGRDFSQYRITTGAETQDGAYTTAANQATANKIAAFFEAGSGASVAPLAMGHYRRLRA